MRPAPLGWAVMLFAVALIVSAGVHVGSCLRYDRARVNLNADVDSFVARHTRGLPIFAPDGRYLWRMDTTAQRLALLGDTVRNPR